MKTLHLFFFLFLFWQFPMRIVGQPTGDSLFAELNHIPDDRVDSLNEFAWRERKANPQLGLQAAYEALKVAEAHQYPKGKGDSYMRLGLILRNAGNYQPAISSYLKAIQIREELQDEAGALSAKNGLTGALSLAGDHEKALDLGLQVLHQKRALDGQDSIALGKSYQNLALIYMELEDYVRALENNFLAAKCFSASNIAEEDLNYAQHEAANIKTNRGTILLKSGQLRAAQSNLLAGWDQQPHKEGETWVQFQLNLGEVLLKMGRPKEALERNLLPAIDSANYHGFLEQETALHGLAAQGFEALKDWELASYHLRRYNELEDARFNDNMAVATVNALWELTLRETQRASELALRREQLLKAFWITFSMLLLLIGWTGYRWLQKRKKRELAHAKTEKQRVRKNLLGQIKQHEMNQVEKLMLARKTERTRTAKELHDRVNNVLAVSKMNLEGMETAQAGWTPEIQERFLTAHTQLEKAIGFIRDISHGLEGGILQEFGLILALREMQTTIETSGQMTVELDHGGLKQELPAEFELSIYQIIQELTTNVIRHAEASFLSIQLSEEDSLLILTVEDNGQGFDLSKVEAKYGMGNRNLRKWVAEMGGTVEFDSSPGSGTAVLIELPIPSANA